MVLMIFLAKIKLNALKNISVDKSKAIYFCVFTSKPLFSYKFRFWKYKISEGDYENKGGKNFFKSKPYDSATAASLFPVI